MLRLIIIFCLCFNAWNLSAQKNDNIIEGAKIVLEVIKMASANKDTSKDKDECLRVLCIENNSQQTIKAVIIPLVRKEQDNFDLLCTVKNIDCSYSLKAEIYSYEIKSEAGILIRKGELNFIQCQEINLKID